MAVRRRTSRDVMRRLVRQGVAASVRPRRRRRGTTEGQRCSMRFLFRLVVVLAVVAAAAYMLGYWSFDQLRVNSTQAVMPPVPGPPGTSAATGRVGEVETQA